MSDKYNELEQCSVTTTIKVGFICETIDRLLKDHPSDTDGMTAFVLYHLRELNLIREDMIEYEEENE